MYLVKDMGLISNAIAQLIRLKLCKYLPQSLVSVGGVMQTMYEKYCTSEWTPLVHVVDAPYIAADQQQQINHQSL